MIAFNSKTTWTKLKTAIADFIYWVTIFILFGATIILTIDTIQTLKENEIDLKSFFPLDISNKVGNTILYEREIEPLLTNIEYNPLHITPPSTDFLQDMFLTDLVNEINTDNPQLLQEKQKIITSFFKTNEQTNHLIPPSTYQNLMMLLPLELLTHMKEDHLTFTLSEEPPLKIEEGIAIATYYRKKNEIVFWNSLQAHGSLFHEIGHWFENYLYKKIDHYRLDRINESMMNELQHLGFDSYYYNYITSDNFEIFATLFEQFFTNYPILYQNAPISHDYILYYLKKVLT